jgi:uncharacterized protein YndB with AHSA1/START domain
MTAGSSVTVHIDAPPEQVYDLVADVTRMGEWSPECVRCEWKDGTPGTVGATFRGHNKQSFVKWSTTARVLAAERGQEFAFATQSGDKDSTVWRYRFAAADGGTDVTESYEAVYVPAYIRWAEKLFVRNRPTQLEQGMRTTLEKVKAVAEAS